MKSLATATVVRRASAAAVTALALSWAAAVLPGYGGPSLGGCYTVYVDSPTTGQHPNVEVCSPL
jgi:hypothetical protein